MQEAYKIGRLVVHTAVHPVTHPRTPYTFNDTHVNTPPPSRSLVSGVGFVRRYDPTAVQPTRISVRGNFVRAPHPFDEAFVSQTESHLSYTE